jgi:hypothetical protein
MSNIDALFESIVFQDFIELPKEKIIFYFKIFEKTLINNSKVKANINEKDLYYSKVPTIV